MDAERLVSGSLDFSVKLWNLTSGECLHTFEGHTNFVHGVDVMTQSETNVTATLISASADGTVKLWSTATGECTRTLTGHKYPYGVYFANVYAPGRIVTGGGDMTIKIWNTDNGECIRTFVGHENSVHVARAYTSKVQVNFLHFQILKKSFKSNFFLLF